MQQSADKPNQVFDQQSIAQRFFEVSPLFPSKTPLTAKVGDISDTPQLLHCLRLAREGLTRVRRGDIHIPSRCRRQRRDLREKRERAVLGVVDACEQIELGARTEHRERMRQVRESRGAEVLQRRHARVQGTHGC